MLFTPEHEELRRSLQKFIAAEVNPHVDEWEEAGIFPAHPLFKKMGDLGFLGLTKPVEYGGQGLDYSYAVVMAEELGNIACGSVPMAIGVQTDMATPALARFGSGAAKREFLAPSTSASPKSAPAPTSPRSRPRHARTAAITLSTAARCGPRMARKPIGCAFSPTPRRARRIRINR
jgi:citronellyl-CoA dehydrogenase